MGAVAFHLVAWTLLERGGQILLARRSSASYGHGLWGLPGGHVMDDETLAQAAARETLEEVGVRTDPAALILLGLTRYVDASGPQTVRGLDAFYLAREWQGEPFPASECSEVAWFAPDHLPADSLAWLAKVMDTHLKRRVAFQEDFS